MEYPKKSLRIKVLILRVNYLRMFVCKLLKIEKIQTMVRRGVRVHTELSRNIYDII